MTRRKPPRRRALAVTCSVWLAIGLAAQLAAQTAEARPGGGHTFSSPSPSSRSSSSSYSSSPSRSSYSRSWSSSGSSGPSGPSGPTTWVDIFFLTAMIGLASGTTLIGAYKGIRDIISDERESRRLTRQYESILTAAAAQPQPTSWSVRPRRPRTRRPKLHERDPNFSVIAFEDLVFRLHAAAYLRAGPDGDLDGLAPYLAPEVRDDLHEHIEVTEAPGGLYDSLREEAARLAGPLRHLQAEHPDLVRLADELVETLGQPAADRAAGTVLVKELLRRLSHHRQRGGDLIFEAYEVDVGGTG